MPKKTLRILISLQLFLVLILVSAVLNFIAIIYHIKWLEIITEINFLIGNLVGLGLSVYIWRAKMKPSYMFKAMAVFVACINGYQFINHFLK